MRNLKKHLIIAAAALAILTAGAFAGNRAFAAEEGPGRDYHASLVAADQDFPPAPPEGFRPGDKRDAPCPPEFRHRPPRHERPRCEKPKKDHKYKEHKKEHKYEKWEKHERHERHGDWKRPDREHPDHE